jgi:hypothetical protein
MDKILAHMLLPDFVHTQFPHITPSILFHLLFLLFTVNSIFRYIYLVCLAEIPYPSFLGPLAR